MASNPYGFISSGNKVSSTNPWSARTKKTTTPETGVTPKNSWDTLGSWTYAGNNAATYPTYTAPASNWVDTSGNTMYANTLSWAYERYFWRIRYRYEYRCLYCTKSRYVD